MTVAISRRRAFTAAVAVLAVSLVAPSTAIAQPTAASPTCTSTGVCTATFRVTGAPQRFVVPAGVDRVTVLVAGGVGAGKRGGAGGQVRASFPVVPGDTLAVLVGARGGQSPDAGTGGGSLSGGGGGSFLFRNGTAEVVVGGGGGSGGSFTIGGPPDYPVTSRSFPGGDGGSGGAGGDGGNNEAGSGARGDAPGRCTLSGDEPCSDGTGPTQSVRVVGLGGGGGGGGGGGWYGGAGGNAVARGSFGFSQAGGGGSGHLAPDVVLLGVGRRLGDGLVTISWKTTAT